MSDGFVLVASRKYVYLQMAINCAETLRDYYPEANITLFTHQAWLASQPGVVDIFDNVITDIPIHKRTKLWALSKSPYDRTMYLDCDTEIMHEDIATVFDTLGDDDIKLTKVRPYAAAASKFPGGDLTMHMGVFVYKNNEATKGLFDHWYHLYDKQTNQPWDLDTYLYPPGLLKPWDIFTFWRLLNIEGYQDKISVGFWEDDARWNFHGFKEEELEGKPVIVYHNSIRDFSHALNMSEEQGSN